MRILILVLTIISMVACKKGDDTPSKPEEPIRAGVGDSIRDGDRTTCNDPVNRMVRDSASVWCLQDMSNEHTIHPTMFSQFYRSRWGNNTPDYKNISWADLSAIIGNYECYDKFLQFTFDSNASSNESIRPRIVDCFSVSPPCYSIPLLQKIASKHKLTAEDSLQFSIGTVENRETVIFKVSKTTTASYDISQWPKFIEDKVNNIIEANERN